MSVHRPDQFLQKAEEMLEKASWYVMLFVRIYMLKLL
jgi:hypothetical protein